jgi:hypothetical protein
MAGIIYFTLLPNDPSQVIVHYNHCWLLLPLRGYETSLLLQISLLWLLGMIGSWDDLQISDNIFNDVVPLFGY